MAGNAQRILVAQMARVWLAPVGTVAPIDPIIAPGSEWRDVGLFTPDSLSWATAPTFADVNSHQSNYITRTFQTGDGASFQVDLQEWSGANFQAVFGGGTITSSGTAPNLTYKFSPPAIGGRSEVSAMLEITDGAKHYRRVVPRCAQREGVAQTFAKSTNSTLPLRLTILGSDIGDPFYDISDDPAFASFTV
jgi:hypothetical protein